MNKIITSPSARIKDYKGFAINISEENGQYIGIAIESPDLTSDCEEQGIQFNTVKESRGNCCKELEIYIDIYRRRKPQKLIIN